MKKGDPVSYAILENFALENNVWGHFVDLVRYYQIPKPTKEDIASALNA